MFKLYYFKIYIILSSIILNLYAEVKWILHYLNVYLMTCRLSNEMLRAS